MDGSLPSCRARQQSSSRSVGWQEVGLPASRLAAAVHVCDCIVPHICLTIGCCLGADDEPDHLFVNWWDNPYNPDSWHKHQVGDQGGGGGAEALSAATQQVCWLFMHSERLARVQ